MDDNKEVKFTFIRTKRRKVVIGGVVAAVLLLGSVVFLAVYFSLSKEKPARLVEIDLKENETLTYRVDQHAELHGSDGQKGKSRMLIFFTVHVEDSTGNLFENQNKYV